MKTVLGLATLGGLVLLTSCQQASQKVPSLCVTRLENNGFANILSTIVMIDGVEAMTLEGDEEACVPLSAGRHDLQLAWLWDPRDPTPRRFLSEPTSVIVVASEPTTRDICWERNADHPTWQIVPHEKVGEFGECRPK